jgi:hypothetical protein
MTNPEGHLSRISLGLCRCWYVDHQSVGQPPTKLVLHYTARELGPYRFSGYHLETAISVWITLLSYVVRAVRMVMYPGLDTFKFSVCQAQAQSERLFADHLRYLKPHAPFVF